MQIQVARNAAQLGTFSIEEIHDGLQSGKFAFTDLAWTEGMENWVPLKVWPQFQALAVVQTADAAQVPEVQLVMPAWERGAGVGNFFRTFYDVIMHPLHTFDHLTATRLWRSATFGVISIGFITTLVGLLAFAIGLIQFLAKRTTPGQPAYENMMKLMEVPLTFAFIVFVLIIYQFMFAGLAHLLLLPWKPARNYTTTYSVISYIAAAWLVCLMWIPVVNFLGFFGAGILLIVACARAHRVAWWKSLISFMVLGFIQLMLCAVIFRWQ